MNARQAIPLIVSREIRSRLLSRPFVIGLLTTVVMVFGVFGVVSLLDRDDPTRIGLLGAQPPGVETTIEALAAIEDTDVEFESVADRARGEEAVREGELDVLVIDGSTLVMERTRPSVVALLTPAYGQARLRAALGDAGLGPVEVDQALASATAIDVVALDADPERTDTDGIAIATVVLL
ncbi:MAG: hypothetical protein AAFN30_12030, partial [Actinomycetota bacterium]